MAIKPILFNTEMVRAILEGRKSCTRRIVKGFIPNDAKWGYTAFTPKGCISCRGTFADGYGEKFFKLPCEPRDILYVREEAARIWLRVTDVRIERLQDITVDGCHREGINIETSAVTDGETLNRNHDFSLEKFETLWDSTVKKSDLDRYGWYANPYVWVIEFERCEKPEGV